MKKMQINTCWLVRIISGKVFDVAVDIRKGGVTFGKWYGVTLSADNKKQLCAIFFENF
jgi:dTDP-4-dehydrorhamnose 3,5-epimerase-like enzyme